MLFVTTILCFPILADDKGASSVNVQDPQNKDDLKPKVDAGMTEAEYKKWQKTQAAKATAKYLQARANKLGATLVHGTQIFRPRKK